MRPVAITAVYTNSVLYAWNGNPRMTAGLHYGGVVNSKVTRSRPDVGGVASTCASTCQGNCVDLAFDINEMYGRPRSHNLKVVGSNPTPATKSEEGSAT
jgi:hypothetical protein